MGQVIFETHWTYTNTIFPPPLLKNNQPNKQMAHASLTVNSTILANPVQLFQVPRIHTRYE